MVLMTRAIATVGHSNHDEDKFVTLLEGVEIDMLVDVRSQPYSRYSPHFNASALKSLLDRHGIRYVHVPGLGGRPEDPRMYDSAGHVLYDKVARSEVFEGAIEWLEGAAETSKVAIMCGEENPTECHRRLLVGRVLQERGWEVRHLRGNGKLMTERELADTAGGPEVGLFEGGEFSAWRSIRSVSPRSQPPSSSVR